ncbi:MAG: ribonuclease H family protein [Porphyromonas sp.]|nr:ribonuclease H family protein [Porphyromonas sp.]
MNKGTYYIVWEGHTPGIYTTWEECRAQVTHFSRPKFRKFKEITRERAEELLAHPEQSREEGEPLLIDRSKEIDLTALSVDAATSGNPGPMEYRGVWVETGDVLFNSKVYPKGTNNIGEFLAIVHAMAWMKQNNYIVPIYTDSMTAQSWIRKHKHNSQLPYDAETAELYHVLERAVKWLDNNDLSPYTIMKWETKEWGEIPADYGRKGKGKDKR